MNNDLARQAIQAALQCNWEKALELNVLILKDNPQNIDALNRLARVCFELGSLDEAVKHTKEALAIDPINTIACRCIQKYSLAKDDGIISTSKLKLNNDNLNSFLEEPGKTKLVLLLHLGDQKTLVMLNPCDEVELAPSKHRVSVNYSNKYVGKLPDDLAIRLIFCMKEGYQYQALIKSSSATEVKVFIREVTRPTKYIHTPSFPLETRSSFIATRASKKRLQDEDA